MKTEFLKLKRKNYAIGLMTLTVFLASSCQNEEPNDNNNKDYIEMSFTGNNDTFAKAQSRTIIDYTGNENTISFDSDESISVFAEANNFTTNYKFNNTPEKNNIFSGTVTVEDSQSNNFYVVYPYNEANKLTINNDNSSTFTVNIPEEQKVNSENNIDNFPSAALVKDNSFNLICLGSLIRITFEGEQENVSKIEKLVLKAKYKLVGTGNATITNGQYTAGLTGDKNDLTILPPDDGFKVGEQYFAVVRPCHAEITLFASIKNNTELQQIGDEYGTVIDLNLTNGRTKVGNLYIKAPSNPSSSSSSFEGSHSSLDTAGYGASVSIDDSIWN